MTFLTAVVTFTTPDRPGRVDMVSASPFGYPSVDFWRVVKSFPKGVKDKSGASSQGHKTTVALTVGICLFFRYLAAL